VSSGRIGILGGSFDPVHYGHCAVARLAQQHFTLDSVLFIPAGIPPHKRHSVSASASERLAMLRCALGDTPHFAIWEGEIERPGKSYTVDSLAILKRELPNSDFFFIIGSDNLHEIPAWHRYEEILKMVTLAVARRPGFDMEPPPELAAATIQAFPSPRWGLSSTMLREMLARGYACEYLIPPAALAYIRKNHLYVTSDRNDHDQK
jgi:nicotinate-nucleotide adenylyltransferase